MTQKTGRFGASGREFCLYSLEKEDIEETLQLMDRCVGENLYQKEELEQAIGSSERAFLRLQLYLVRILSLSVHTGQRINS